MPFSLGKALLKDAMQRTMQAADIAGIRAFAVHAKDEQARSFYQKFDFIPSLPTACISSSCGKTYAGLFQCNRPSAFLSIVAAALPVPFWESV